MADYAATCPRLAAPLERDVRASLARWIRPLFERIARRWLEAGDMTEELYRCKAEYGRTLGKYLYHD
jgi:hypothetical protein